MDKKEYITALKTLHERKGKCRAKDLQEYDDMPSIYLIRKTFGSWKAALEAAGIDSGRTRSKKYTDEELIEALHELYKREGECVAEKLNQYHDLPEMITFVRRFGSWRKAIEVSGIRQKMRRPISKNTKDELIAALHELREREGSCTVKGLKKNNDLPTHGCYLKVFGSWNAAVSAAGFEPNHGRRKTKHEIKGGESTKEAGGFVSELDVECEHATAYMLECYGSWGEAEVALGIH